MVVILDGGELDGSYGGVEERYLWGITNKTVKPCKKEKESM